MNAVIFLGIVLMWAVVLVPMWLRRHDEAEETRSVDRFSTAMHTLSRRESAAPEKQYVVMPRRNWLRDVHVSGASALDGRGAIDRGSAFRRLIARRAAARRELSAAQRRRRTLSGLLVATVLTVLLAAVIGGTALWTLQILADLLLVGFVVHLRTQVRNAAQLRPSARRSATAPRRRTEYAAASYQEPSYEEPPVAPRGADPRPRYDEDFAPVAVPQHRSTPAVALDDTTWEPAEVEPAAAAGAALDSSSDVVSRDADVAAAGAALGAATDAEDHIGSRPWEPIPVPRPTYTSKPPAPPRRRRAPTFEPIVPPSEQVAEHELDPVDDLEEILDRRWAVND